MIGERLKEVRKSLNYSQIEFSEQLGLHQGSYSDIENGKSNATKMFLLLLQYRYSINPDWLLTGEGSMFISENADKKKFTLSYSKDDMNADIQRTNEKLMQKILKLEKEIAVLEAKEKEANKELLAAYRRIAQFFERKPTESPS